MSAMGSKPQSEEYKAFEALLGNVLSVSKAEIQRRLELEKAEKGSSVMRSSDKAKVERPT